MAFIGYKDDLIDYLPLKDYLSFCNNEKDRKNLFVSMDVALKSLHNNNYFVKDFNINNIYVYFNGNDNVYVKFLDVHEGLDFSIKQKNIFYLSCFAIGVYTDCLPYMNPSKPDFLISNFSEFAQFIPEDSIPYYKGVICSNATVYYSDYISAKNKKEIEELKKLDTSNSGGTGKGIMLTKATAVGKMNASDDVNQAAFISILLFPVIILLLSFLLPFFTIVFS